MNSNSNAVSNATVGSMAPELLIPRLYDVARASLASANKGNPFISKSEAMKDINMSRELMAWGAGYY